MPVSSTGDYDQTSPPGVVIIVTDTGGGSRTRNVTIRLNWNPSRVVVGSPGPPSGAVVDAVRGTCVWNKQCRLGGQRFKMGLRSNGTGVSSARAVVINRRAGRTRTFRHTIRIPNRAAKGRKKA